MKKNLSKIVGSLICLLFSGQVVADQIDVTPTECVSLESSSECWMVNPGDEVAGGGNSAPNLGPEDITTVTGIEGLTEAYIAEVDDGESGVFASWYDTSFTNSPEDPSDFLIEWDEGDVSIDCSETCLLYIKDGKQNPYVYIFDISADSSNAWDGVSNISGTGFWPDGGAISNIRILTTGSVSVPEPGTLALLGLGLVGLGIRRRREAIK